MNVGSEFNTQKEGKNSYQYSTSLRTHLFEVQPPRSPKISLLHSLSLGILKNSAEFSSN
jgi:hypothetical protein